MKTKHSNLPVALLSSLTLFTGVACAADPEYPTNPERSFTTQSTPAFKTRAEVRAELDEFRRDPVTADGWQDVGGERGEALIPHKYAFVDGKFMPSGNFDYSAASPSRILTVAEQKMASLNYRNAP